MALFINGKGPLDPYIQGKVISTMWYRGKKIYGRHKEPPCYGWITYRDPVSGSDIEYMVETASDWATLFGQSATGESNMVLEDRTIKNTWVIGWRFNTNPDSASYTPVSINNGFLQGMINLNSKIEFPSWVTSLGNSFMKVLNGQQVTFNKDIDLANITTIGSEFLMGHTSAMTSISTITGNEVTTVNGNLFWDGGTGYTSFNGNFEFDKLKTITGRFLSYLSNFNHPVVMPELETIGLHSFVNMPVFNSTVSLPKLKTVGQIFNIMPVFNKPVDLPSIEQATMILNQCNVFNNTVHIGANATAIGSLHTEMPAFNNTITIDADNCTFGDLCCNSGYAQNGVYRGTFVFKNGSSYNGNVFRWFFNSDDTFTPTLTVNCDHTDILVDTNQNTGSWLRRSIGTNVTINLTGPGAAGVAGDYTDYYQYNRGRKLVAV